MRVADEFVAIVKDECERLEVAGSIRRRRPEVGDIDIVLVPKDPFMFNLKLTELQKKSILRPVVKKDGKIADGNKIKSFVFKDVQVDVYIATMQTWATLLLIRTGSKEHNIRLASLAKQKGWKLHASGEGLFDEKGNRVAGDTEESLFEALGVEYLRPGERDGKGI